MVRSASTESVPNNPFYCSSGAHGGQGYVYLNCTNNLPSGFTIDGVVGDRPEVLSLTCANAPGRVPLVYRGLACVQYTVQSPASLTQRLDRTNQMSGQDGLFYWTDENDVQLLACFYRVRQN